MLIDRSHHPSREKAVVRNISTTISVFEVAPSHAIFRGEVMCAERTARAVRVQLGHLLRLLEFVQNRCEELPRVIQLVISDEEPLVAIDCIENETLVRVRQLVLVLGLVDEIEIRPVEAEPNARDLVVNAKINARVRLETNDELICRHIDVRAEVRLVEVARNVSELHADLRLALCQRLTRFL